MDTNVVGSTGSHPGGERSSGIDSSIDHALDRALAGARLRLMSAVPGQDSARRLVIAMGHADKLADAPAYIVLRLDDALADRLTGLRCAVEVTGVDAVIVTSAPDDWSARRLDGEAVIIEQLDSLQMRVSASGFTFEGCGGLASATVGFGELAAFIRSNEMTSFFTDVTCGLDNVAALTELWLEEREAPGEAPQSPRQ